MITPFTDSNTKLRPQKHKMIPDTCQVETQFSPKMIMCENNKTDFATLEPAKIQNN